MKVLIACEYSGAVRDAMLALGHDAMSCDLLPTDVPGPHYQGDVMDILGDGWDLMIAHPPCTFLCSASAKHLYMLDERGVSTLRDEVGERIPNPARFKARWKLRSATYAGIAKAMAEQWGALGALEEVAS